MSRPTYFAAILVLCAIGTASARHLLQDIPATIDHANGEDVALQQVTESGARHENTPNEQAPIEVPIDQPDTNVVTILGCKHCHGRTCNCFIYGCHCV